MGSSVFPLALLVLVLAFFSGCSEVITRTKTPSERPKITEEDITDTRPEQPPQLPPAEPSQGIGSGSTISTEGSPPDVNPVNRPPRRLIWRDRGQSERRSAPGQDSRMETGR